MKIGLSGFSSGAQSASQHWRLTRLHASPDHRLVLWQRGQGVAILGGRRRGTGVNNVLFIPAGEPVALHPGAQAQGQVLRVAAGEWADAPTRPLLIRLRDMEAQGRLASYLDGVRRETEAGQPLAERAALGWAGLALIWLLRRTEGAEALPDSAAARLTAAFLHRLEAHHKSGASMADHAVELGVTPTHLSRACKAATGQTAADLMSERSLHAALSMLRDTRISARDIAAELGFGSAAYFTRFIRKHTGRRPTDLRAS